MVTGHSSETNPAESSVRSEIPFKKDHGSVERATSVISTVLVLIVLIAIAIYFLSKKYSLNVGRKTISDTENIIKEVQINRLTANSLVVSFVLEGKTYYFIESKANLVQIDKI